MYIYIYIYATKHMIYNTLFNIPYLIYIYIYIYKYIYPISYIQYGNIPIRDSPPPHPTPCWGRPQRGRGGGSMGWGGVGGNPVWVYFHIGYRIMDFLFFIYIYIYVYILVFSL